LNTTFELHTTLTYFAEWLTDYTERHLSIYNQDPEVFAGCVVPGLILDPIPPKPISEDLRRLTLGTPSIYFPPQSEPIELRAIQFYIEASAPRRLKVTASCYEPLAVGFFLKLLRAIMKLWEEAREDIITDSRLLEEALGELRRQLELARTSWGWPFLRRPVSDPLQWEYELLQWEEMVEQAGTEHQKPTKDDGGGAGEVKSARLEPDWDVVLANEAQPYKDMAKLWWHGYRKKEIGKKVGYKWRTVRNILRRLRKEHGTDVIPTHEQLKEMKVKPRSRSTSST